ncbi:MAG: hypothetical protein GY861_02860 [bacterium]|nr:hypothetical protein [bacterium]
MITPRDFTAWLKMPVTVEYKRVLEEALFKLAHGSMTEAVSRDQIGNAIMTGKYQATKELLIELEQADFYELFGGEPDEQDGDSTSGVQGTD